MIYEWYNTFKVVLPVGWAGHCSIHVNLYAAGLEDMARNISRSVSITSSGDIFGKMEAAYMKNLQKDTR